MSDPGTDPGSPEEPTYGTFPMTGWRYTAVEVGYEQARIVPGRPVMAMVAAGTCAVVNRRRRHAAMRLAAPQWRPLGDVTVTVTDRRLLVLYQGVWASVWLDAITGARPHLEVGYIELTFANDPPYALGGPWAPSLWSVLEALVTQRSLACTAGGTVTTRSRIARMGQDRHVRNAVASAQLEGVELDPAVVAILEAAAAGEMTSDQARRKILAEHGVELPAGHRLAQPAHAR